MGPVAHAVYFDHRVCLPRSLPSVPNHRQHCGPTARPAQRDRADQDVSRNRQPPGMPYVLPRRLQIYRVQEYVASRARSRRIQRERHPIRTGSDVPGALASALALAAPRALDLGRISEAARHPVRGVHALDPEHRQARGARGKLDARAVPRADDVRAVLSYRGFMLDTARNFFPVADIKRTLDAMSWVKLNMFHWHIVDSQSFPLSLPDFPELAQKGAYSANEIYSPQDVQDIVQYAAERGIDVLMEIDTPGHTTAIGESHPEYIACNKASPWTTYANEPPAGQLRLATPAVVNFTASLIGAAAKVLPGQYFSTGGDELNTECYVKDPQTQADLKKSGHKLEQALDAFTQATHGALLHLGKTPVVWEEMVLDFNLKLSNETVVMVWISAADAASVVEKNFRIVHSASDYFYLDCGAGEWIGDTSTATSWCDPFKSWQWSYTFDPLANISSSKSHLVLGGEQLLWTEQTDPSNLDPIVWPRAATSAEIFWTGPKLPSGKARTGVEALPRLHDLRYRMVQRGVRAIPIQPQWCALRPESCLSAS
ncbi:unnamed protein product [Mycena citricolor]|uniref:beta-N-acetylhexosaminidase n=1 Tax=Mycena citricolor TaxID=2018698 RepID=A0AAD2HY96_9AGAR|nr:unnamed protein product [Mycena citricolor]